MRYFIILLSILVLSGCHQAGAASTLEDYYGREVSVETAAERVICIGPNALRLYSYIGPVEHVVGIEQFEINRMGYDRPYSMLYEDRLDALQVIGQGGPQGSLDFEAIIKARPDVIFISNHFDQASIDDLARRTQTKVVTVTMDTADGNVFSDELYASLELIGAVMNETARSTAVIRYFDAVKSDLENRVEKENEKTNVYLGSLSRGGAQGLFSTSGTYDVFDLLKLNNVAKAHGIKGHAFIDQETLLSFNPDHIILDVMGINPVLELRASKEEYFTHLKAFNKEQVYVQMPYNFYATNLEIALVNNVYIGKSLYPEAFKDVSVEVFMNEVSQFLLGYELYDALKAIHPMGYETIKINE